VVVVVAEPSLVDVENCGLNGFYGAGSVVSVAADSLVNGLSFCTARYPLPVGVVPASLRFSVYDFDTGAAVVSGVVAYVNWDGWTTAQCSPTLLSKSKKYILMCEAVAGDGFVWRLRRSRDNDFPKLLDGLVFVYCSIYKHSRFGDAGGFWVPEVAQKSGLIVSFKLELEPIQTVPSNPVPLPPVVPTPDPEDEKNKENGKGNNAGAGGVNVLTFALVGLVVVVLIGLVAAYYYM